MKKYLQLNQEERETVRKMMTTIIKDSDLETIDIALIDANPFIENNLVSVNDLKNFRGVLSKKEETYPKLK